MLIDLLFFFAGCRPNNAHYVAVTAPINSSDVSLKSNAIIASLTGCFTSVLSFLFSNASQRGEGSSTSVTFCKVRMDKTTGTRYFYFRLRRFVYDAASNRFVLGRWDVQEGVKIGEWLDSSYLHQGLSNDEAVRRRGIVGPNVLELKKPTVIGSICTEFSKTFYLYQNFMVWTWGKITNFSHVRILLYPLTSLHTVFSGPFWYYYMAIVNTCIRVTGGIVVAGVQYMSDKNLYRLMVMKGTVEVLRGGEMTVMDQTEVVPGDIVCLVVSFSVFVVR